MPTFSGSSTCAIVVSHRLPMNISIFPTVSNSFPSFPSANGHHLWLPTAAPSNRPGVPDEVGQASLTEGPGLTKRRQGVDGKCGKGWADDGS